MGRRARVREVLRRSVARKLPVRRSDAPGTARRPSGGSENWLAAGAAPQVTVVVAKFEAGCGHTVRGPTFDWCSDIRFLRAELRTDLSLGCWTAGSAVARARSRRRWRSVRRAGP